MRQPDALAGPVLLAGAAEQVEHALPVVLVDPAPVVADLVDRARAVGTALDLDPAALVRPGYLSALSTRFEKTCSNAKRSLVIGGNESAEIVAPAASAWCARLAAIERIISSISTGSGLNSRRPSRESFRMALIRRSILMVEVLMNPIASPKSAASASSCGGSVDGAWARNVLSRARTSSRSASISLVNPMMLTSGARRSWLTI